MGVNLQKLGNSNWWLSSPNNYNGSNAFEWNVNYSSGNLNNNAFRLSVSLVFGVKIANGDGSISNPYTIQ